MPSRQPPTFIESARRAQIIASAIETIAELGYGRASLVRIAQRAGTSKGVVTYHFASKDELIAAVYDEAIARAREYVVPRVAAASSGTDAIRAYVDSNVAFMCESRDLMVAIVEIVANARGDDGLPLYGVKKLGAIVAPLEQLLVRHQATGEFREFDDRAMAFAIRAVIDSVPPRMVRDPDLDVRGYGTEIATAFVLAVRNQPGRAQKASLDRQPDGQIAAAPNGVT